MAFFWKRYYYSYLETFVNFLVPKGKSVCRIDSIVIPAGKFDYLIALDVLWKVGDVSTFLSEAKDYVEPRGRLVVTHFNALWEPILRLASRFKLRKVTSEQNWLTVGDWRNLSHLAGWEIVKSGTKMLMPVYLPLVSNFFNYFLAQFWPFSRLGLFHYLVLRQIETPTTDKRPSFSIIVPARNEAGTIEKIERELPAVGSFTEIIFVEGHSTDQTLAEIKRVTEKQQSAKRLRYAVQEGQGKGDAVRRGFEMASGDILAIYDADMTVPPDELRRFYDALVQNKADFVNGSRLVYRMKKESMRTLNLLGNKFFSLTFTWIIGQPIKDTLCGTKVLWKKDYEAVRHNRSYFGDFDPFGDFDLILGAAKLNLKIVDMPIHYRERIYGRTNISRFRHGWLLLKMALFAMKKLKFV